jgi:hypothetical protein
MDKIILTYTTQKDSKDGFKDVKIEKQTFSTTHMKYYKEGIEQMRKLSKAERALFDYLASTSNQLGIIYSNASTREDFIKYTSIDGEPYTDGTVKFAMAELKRKGFLIEKTRGVLWVNPVYVWNGNEADRAAAIQQVYKITHDNVKVRIES